MMESEARGSNVMEIVQTMCAARSSQNTHRVTDSKIANYDILSAVEVVHRRFLNRENKMLGWMVTSIVARFVIETIHTDPELLWCMPTP